MGETASELPLGFKSRNLAPPGDPVLFAQLLFDPVLHFWTDPILEVNHHLRLGAPICHSRSQIRPQQQEHAPQEETYSGNGDRKETDFPPASDIEQRLSQEIAKSLQKGHSLGILAD
jgi:hypothetical protein